MICVADTVHGGSTKYRKERLFLILVFVSDFNLKMEDPVYVKLDPEMVEHEHLIQDATGKSEEISSVNSNSNLKTKYNEVLEVENCNLFSDYEIMENVLVDPDSRSSPIMGTGNLCASTFKTNQRSLLKRPAEPVTLANISPPTSNLDQFLKMAGEHQARKHNEARRVAEVAAAQHGNTKTAFRSILNLNRGPEIRKRIIRVRKFVSNLPYPEAGTERYRPIKNIRERLRRKEMTDLYSELQNLVDIDMVKLDKIGRVSVGKMSYEDTMNAARTCIGRLEVVLHSSMSDFNVLMWNRPTTDCNGTNLLRGSDYYWAPCRPS